MAEQRWAVTSSTHPLDQCEHCAQAKRNAIIHARVTGSTGASHIEDRPDGTHRVDVTRALQTEAKTAETELQSLQMGILNLFMQSSDRKVRALLAGKHSSYTTVLPSRAVADLLKRLEATWPGVTEAYLETRN